MLQIAHRGYSHKFGDNNIVSFREAVNAGFDMIELDVQFSLDDVPVIFHDIYVDGKYVRELDCEELSLKHNVLTLEAFLREFANCDIDLFFDIKGDVCVVEKVLELIMAWVLPEHRERIYISSFNRKIARGGAGGVHMGFTSDNTFHLDEWASLLESCVCDFVCLHWTALDCNTISFLKSRNVKIFSYTCCDAFVENHMKQFDLDGIVTNYVLK